MEKGSAQRREGKMYAKMARPSTMMTTVRGSRLLRGMAQPRKAGVTLRDGQRHSPLFVVRLRYTLVARSHVA